MGVGKEQIEGCSAPAAHPICLCCLTRQGSPGQIKLVDTCRAVLWTLLLCSTLQLLDGITCRDIANPVVTVWFLLHKKGVVQVLVHICHAGWTLPVTSAFNPQLHGFAMSAPTSTFGPGSVPSGQSAPFVIASPTDHSADIVIVAATGVALILVTFAIRIYIRFSFSGPWQADDTVFALSTVRSPDHGSGLELSLT